MLEFSIHDMVLLAVESSMCNMVSPVPYAVTLCYECSIHIASILPPPRVFFLVFVWVAVKFALLLACLSAAFFGQSLFLE